MDFVKSLPYPEELFALAKFRLFGCPAVHSKCDMESLQPDIRTCYNFLKQTSRSFSAVIMALDDDLRYAVCIYYLVLRALDTIEDDMTIPVDEKILLLKSFHEKLNTPGWNYTKSQEKDRVVLEQFSIISSEFRTLSSAFQAVISESCREMGYGMTLFLKNRIDSYQEWDEYCHYVAGLVGIGLSSLFVASGLEDKIVGDDERISNSMGLFLQKTNIIRDYLEDINQNRMFWPKEAWSQYGHSLESFKEPANIDHAVDCLNELITNALTHIPDVLVYLDRLKNQSIFNFCAIPQMMAIATLERCYNNSLVFRQNVKIRKGLTVMLMNESTNMPAVRNIMLHFCNKINCKIRPGHPDQLATRIVLTRGLKTEFYPGSPFTTTLSEAIIAMLFAVAVWKYWKLTNFHGKCH